MRIKKVLLLNPDSTVEKGCIRRLVTPLGLIYTAAAVEKAGIDVEVIDSTCDGYENVIYKEEYAVYGLSDDEIENRIRDIKPDLIGVSCSFSYLESRVISLCGLIKLIDKDIITVVGGIHPSYMYREMMRKSRDIDYVIINEGEDRLVHLIKNINNSKTAEDIDGIVYRNDGDIIVNQTDNFIQDIDKIPLPARHLIDIEKYISINKNANPFSKGDRVERMITSRGCPYNCCFCSGSNYWGNIRLRSVDNIMEELSILKDKYRIDEIQFSDDNMTINKKRCMELFSRMKEFGFSWCTPSGILLTTLDDELVKVMAESGCYQVTLSPETGSQRVLNEIIHKPLDLKRVRPVVDILHKHGIGVHSNFILGLPGETLEEFMMTFEFAKQSDFDSAAFFIANPYPGTPLYNQCLERGWLKETTETSDFKHANIQISEKDPEYIMLPEEMVRLVDEKTIEFNEWSKKNKPDYWQKKYNKFISKHTDESDKIMGRVV